MSCISGGDYGKNWGMNVGFGILNFFGVGDFIKSASGAKTPLDQLKDKLSDINNSTQEIMQQGNLMFMNTQVEIDKSLLEAIQLGNSDIIASLNFIREGLSEKIATNQVYIIFCYLFFIVIYIYIMLQK